MPAGQGIWPAFWMLGASFKGDNQPVSGWPQCGEIDVVELIGGGRGRDDRINHHIHWDKRPFGHADWGGYFDPPSRDLQNEFHVYAIEWDQYQIRAYFDDIYWFSSDITINDTGAFHQPHFLLLNLAVGGQWPGNPDKTTVFPQRMEVDWVRWYQWEGGPLAPKPAPPPPAPVKRDWELVWQDKFDGKAIDRTKWAFDIGTGEEHGLKNWGNGEIACYTDRPENSRIEDGKLVIEARQEKYKGSRYTSARLKTQGLQDWTYGKFERVSSFLLARMCNRPGGCWAILMTGTTGQNAGKSMRPWFRVAAKGDVLTGGMYWFKASADPNWQNASWGGGTRLETGSFADAYHIITLEWEDYELRWYLDNVRFHAALINRNDTEAFSQPFFMLLNLSIRGDTFQETDVPADDAMHFRIETFNSAEWVDLRVKRNGGPVTGYRMEARW